MGLTISQMIHICLIMSIRVSSRTAIIEAAFDVFGRNLSAPLSEVARAAGVGRATLHRHFSSRETLVRALAKQAEAELNAAIRSATRPATSHMDGLKRAMAASIPLASRQLFLTRALPHDDPDRRRAEARDTAETIAAIEAARAEGSLPGSVPAPWAARVYDGLIYAAWEAVSAQELTPDQAARLAWSTFLDGIKGAET